MKALCTLVLTSLATVGHAADFVSPIDFGGTEEEKAAVVAYIEEHTKESLARIDMDDPQMLRLSESQNLEAFKKLLNAENHEILTDVIDQMCMIGMCDYQSIELSYRQQLEASQQKLEW